MVQGSSCRFKAVLELPQRTCELRGPWQQAGVEAGKEKSAIQEPGASLQEEAQAKPHTCLARDDKGYADLLGRSSLELLGTASICRPLRDRRALGLWPSRVMELLPVVTNL